MTITTTLTSAERETMAAALGCEFHEPGYGECAACASHAEQVWDDAVEAVIAARVAEAWDEGWRKGQQYRRDDGVREMLNPYTPEPTP